MNPTNFSRLALSNFEENVQLVHKITLILLERFDNLL